MNKLLTSLTAEIACFVVGATLLGFGYGIESNRQVDRALLERDEAWKKAIEDTLEESSDENTEE